MFGRTLPATGRHFLLYKVRHRTDEVMLNIIFWVPPENNHIIQDMGIE